MTISKMYGTAVKNFYLSLLEYSGKNRKRNGQRADDGKHRPLGRALDHRNPFRKQRSQKSETDDQNANYTQCRECNCNGADFFHDTDPFQFLI